MELAVTEYHQDTCERLVIAEQDKFLQDYKSHSIPGESKPQEIGMPFLLRQAQPSPGILLVHGLMAAPEEVAQWADHLFKQGYTVYAVRLMGHGTSPHDLETKSHYQWQQSVRQGGKILTCCSTSMIIAGFSTGAALALNQAIQNPTAFRAVISISAPLKLASFSANFVEPLNKWNQLMKRFSLNCFTKRFATNHPDNPHINYKLCPINSLVEIKLLMKKVVTGLPTLNLPILVIHGNKDPKVDISSSKTIFKTVGSSKKHFKEINFHQHGIVRGEISQEVFKEMDEFLKAI